MSTDRITLQERYEQLERELQDQDVLRDSSKLQKFSKEYNELGQLLEKYGKLDAIRESIGQVEATLKDESDSEVRELAEEELSSLRQKQTELEELIKEALNPANPLDKKDIIVEIRAGTGGDEAALFAADLFRMYSRYAERKSWKTNLLNSSRTGIGGLKEVIFEINGRNVYSDLKYESGVHRVQRVPDTEKSGRIHTSAATVAILPAAEEVDIELKPEDLDIQATTSSGAGGQSVNTSYSAIRIIHKPTNTMVTCQDERSQRQNKEKALQVLRSRLLAIEEEKRSRERADARKNQIGSGDRSEKIRTYNFPQDRVTDHRIKKSYHGLNAILDGGLASVIRDLKAADQPA
ncbi:MAG: peptide chain release factor 1 [Patescibacteria group bacterium]